MRHLLPALTTATAPALIAALAAGLAACPAAAQTVEELQAELAAQREINALLKQRIETLEAELAGRVVAPPPRVAVAPGIAPGDPEAERALERALVRRGSTVLPPDTYEVTPGFFWSHSGPSVADSDLFGATLDLRAGLPMGWNLGATVPLLHRDIDGFGENTGFGDVSATVSKELWGGDETWPSVVASLRYGAPTGDDFAEDPVSLGDGFHNLTGRLSFLRTVDPVAFFADLSYTAFLSDTISGADVDRDGTFAFGLGASLAVTPSVSFSAGIDLAFEDELEINGVDVPGTDATIAVVQVGAGVLLTRNVFLTFTGGFGVTDDSPDVILGVSLPIRF